MNTSIFLFVAILTPFSIRSLGRAATLVEHLARVFAQELAVLLLLAAARGRFFSCQVANEFCRSSKRRRSDQRAAKQCDYCFRF
ncbi:MAG TPA: hypothetical protein VE486_07555 [Candidatus Baltobacteraceae bacterium]|nr:hypothetical protein [Candidatus Baltobacteraceae bacterium]